MVIYPGHHEGLIESKLIDAFSYQLPSNLYLVCRYQNYNRPFSPYIITISKNKL
ncbi:MAG: class I SAM-dependent methyltransferase [Bacilli bacterium]